MVLNTEKLLRRIPNCSILILYPTPYNILITEFGILRGSLNKCNVSLYFENHSPTILQLAAGDRVVAGALSEDIAIMGENPRLLAKKDESLKEYLPFRRKFDEIVSVSPVNVPKSNKDYSWLLTVSSPILKAQSKFYLVGTERQPAFQWLWTAEENNKLAEYGYKRSSPKGIRKVEVAEARFKALKTSVITNPPPWMPPTINLEKKGIQVVLQKQQ